MNIADTLTLKKLQGVVSIFSKIIIKYRDLLGGFSNKSQLLEVYGIDSSLYQKLSPYVYVGHKSLKKINLNYASVYQLKAHPYLDYKESNAIVKYRIQHGKFRSNSELMNLHLFDTLKYRKILPYLHTNDSAVNR